MPIFSEIKNRKKTLGYQGWHLDRSTSAARFAATSFMESVMDASASLTQRRQDRASLLPQSQHLLQTKCSQEDLNKLADSVLSSVTASMKTVVAQSKLASRKGSASGAPKPVRPSPKRAEASDVLHKLASTVANSSASHENVAAPTASTLSLSKHTSTGFSPFKQTRKTTLQISIPQERNTSQVGPAGDTTALPTTSPPPVLDAVTKSPVGGLVHTLFTQSSGQVSGHVDNAGAKGKRGREEEPLQPPPLKKLKANKRVGKETAGPNALTSKHDKHSTSSGEDSPVDVWKFPLELPSPDSHDNHNSPSHPMISSTSSSTSQKSSRLGPALNGQEDPQQQHPSLHPFSQCLTRSTLGSSVLGSPYFAPDPMLTTPAVLRQMRIANVVAQKQLLEQYSMLFGR